MKSIDIYRNVKNIKIYNEININVNNISIDTRTIKDNDCFIGVKGEKFDGNTFYKEAFKNGASICILDNYKESEEDLKYLKDNDKSIVLVNNSIIALGELAKYVRSNFKYPVIAITGSSGKTSTKDMIYSVLKKKYNVHKTPGNKNNFTGLPTSLLSIEQDTNMLVLEMGMNHLGEISYLTNIVKPDVAIITNVGTAHIGNLGSRENILKAKLEILEGLKENGIIIINNDSDLLHEWYLNNKNKYNIITIGIENESDYQAINIKEYENGSEFYCNSEKYFTNVGGKHFIYNSLISIAIGHIYNVKVNDIKKGLGEFKISDNRMNIIKKNNMTIIDDTYNANYDSMKYAIKYLGTLKGRKIAVLGDMKELGNYSIQLHSELGKLIYQEGIDILITVGEYSKYINDVSINMGFNKNNSYHLDNNKSVIDLINKIKEKNDNILLKASNSMKFSEISDKLK